MRRLCAAGLFLAMLLVVGVQAGAGARALASRPRAGTSVARWPSYPWPVKPFNRQHPIRSVFGEPRTDAVDQPFGQTGPNKSGRYSFHNGVDIYAPTGTPVYPVVSGLAVVRSLHKVVVRTSDGRSFQYDHLDLAVHSGQRVRAEHTILGSIIARFEHVHLGEIDTEPNGHVHIQNPLAPGHLEPYQDQTTPRATSLYLDNGHGPRPLDGVPLQGHDRLVVAAVDPPPLPVPGPFLGLPQVPALVEWRLFNRRIHTPWQIAADFRTTLPLRRDFWHVYAPGTYQNCPVFAHRHDLGQAGRYLFHLHLDPSRLRSGRYRLQVRVTDIRHNHSTSTWRVRVP